MTPAAATVQQQPPAPVVETSIASVTPVPQANPKNADIAPTPEPVKKHKQKTSGHATKHVAPAAEPSNENQEQVIIKISSSMPDMPYPGDTNTLSATSDDPTTPLQSH